MASNREEAHLKHVPLQSIDEVQPRHLPWAQKVLLFDDATLLIWTVCTESVKEVFLLL